MVNETKSSLTLSLSRSGEGGEVTPSRVRGSRSVRLLVGILVLASVATAVGLDVVRANGYLRWDDAQYLYRGIYHARQVSRHAHLLLPRLVYSLSFETPKPPLFTGWIALGALSFGYTAVPKLLFWSTAPVFFALLATVFLTARRLAGDLAGWLAAACALSFPGVLLFGGNLMVETMLALWILLAIVMAALWMENPTPLRSSLLGVSIGLALLTKLTAGMFLLPSLLYAAIVLARRRGLSRLVGPGLVIAGCALAACGWWYARRVSDAVEFARWSSRFPGFVGRVSVPRRLAQAATGSVGWWGVAVAVLLIGTLLARTPPTPRSIVRTNFSRMTLLSAAFALAVVCTSPYFDPRFLVPIAPSLAVVTGTSVASLISGRGIPALLAVSLVLLFGLFLSVHGYRERQAGGSIPKLASLMGDVNRRFAPGLRLGLVGNDSRFNCFELELANVLQSDYTRTELISLNDRSGSDANSFVDVDAVLAIASCPVSTDFSVQYLNRNCESLRRALEAGGSGAGRARFELPGENRSFDLFNLRGRR